MKKIELDELKQIELDMIKYLDKICVDNNIPYFICGGTLLGAIRHKGFIPWDDDIDIAMPRQYYSTLKDIIDNDNTFYKLAFYDNTDNYGYSMPKLFDTRTKLIDLKLGSGKEEISVFIDVFLFDGMGNSLIESKIRFLLLRCLKRMVFLSRRSFVMESKLKTAVFFLPCVVCKTIGTNRINRVFNKLCAIKKTDESKYSANVSGRYGLKKELFETEIISNISRVQFEDTKVNGLVEYDKLLKQLYGDYMKLPPINKQISNHTSEEWWI